METSDRKLGVFSLGLRIAYIGEVVHNDADNLKLTRVLMLEREVNPQTGQIGAGSIGPVEHASRESVIEFNKRLIAGTFITEPNADLVKVYDREIGPCYSPLVSAKSNLSL